jgi:hypothetical protein
MSSSSITNSQSPEIFPQLDVLGEDSEFLVAGDIGQQSKLSKGLSVAFPKLHALFTTNLAAARNTNRPYNERVLGQVQFNEMIDELVKEIEKPEVNISNFTSQYMDEKNFGHEMRDYWRGIPFRDTNDMAKVKEDLLAAKFNTSFFSKGVVRLTNIAESLARTGLESKKVEWTDLSSQRSDVALQRTAKIEQAEEAFKVPRNLNADLEQLLMDLYNKPEFHELNGLFQKFLGFRDEMKRLCGTGRHGARRSELLDQLDGSEASKVKFYEDLLKSESSYLQILLRSVVKAKDEAIAKAEELDLAKREVRGETFNKIDLRFDFRSFIVFKDVFNKFNNFTFSKHIVSRPMSMFKASMIDRSVGSFFATVGIVIWVASYTFFQIAKAAVACASATIAYLFTSIFWVGYVSGRYVFGQGFDRLKDEYTKKNQPQDNSLRDQAAIADATRIPSLQAALNDADFYKAHMAAKELKAHMAALKMQALERGHRARMAFRAKKEAAAALKMQALARTCLARKMLKAQAEAEEAALKMQALARTCLARKAFRDEKEAAAALKMQALARTCLARKMLKAQAEAEEAEIIREGDAAGKFLAKYQKALEALARAQTLMQYKLSGKSLTQSLQASRDAAAVARKNTVSMFQSMGHGHPGVE